MTKSILVDVLQSVSIIILGVALGVHLILHLIKKER